MHVSLKVDMCMQELFPRSYAETADWLRRERTAYHDTLARCEDELKTLLQTDSQLASLAVTCQARFSRHLDLASFTCPMLASEMDVPGGHG